MVLVVFGRRRRSASARFVALSPALRMSSARLKAASAMLRSMVAPGTVRPSSTRMAALGQGQGYGYGEGENKGWG